ncbi:MAG: hypothetical protein LBE25_08710 [Arthrobacter sp.]|jgi:hypothetical protein|nr:hypothetical protein [Arthrobacter sp.]
MSTTQTPLQSNPAAAEAAHQHGWRTASQHATSEGWIAYARCEGCGAMRVERRGAARGERTPLSREVGGGEEPAHPESRAHRGA